MSNNGEELFPSKGSIVYFTKATAFARDIDLKPKLVKLSGSHRGKMADLEDGYIIIRKSWYIKRRE